jgi:hypothetical protein
MLRMMYRVTKGLSGKSLISIGGIRLFIIPVICIGSALFVSGYLFGYEKAEKEEQEFESFWKDVEKHGL